jgi:hypothetical protein
MRAEMEAKVHRVGKRQSIPRPATDRTVRYRVSGPWLMEHFLRKRKVPILAGKDAMHSISSRCAFLSRAMGGEL